MLNKNKNVLVSEESVGNLAYTSHSMRLFSHKSCSSSTERLQEMAQKVATSFSRVGQASSKQDSSSPVKVVICSEFT